MNCKLLSYLHLHFLPVPFLTRYHFHETGMTAPVRRDHSVRDWRELNLDAANIAAFLLRLGQEQSEAYEKIRETVQLIAPFFDDFLLEQGVRRIIIPPPHFQKKKKIWYN
jgi:predicted ATPase